jgi:Lar family restriction alleviation protein
MKSLAEDIVLPPVPLKPCPFCGQDGLLHRLGGKGSTHGYIECDGCHTSMPLKPTFEEAAEKWNQRRC